MPPHGPGFSGALHSHDAEFPDDDWNLYSMIDLEGVKALNATIPEDAARIFKPFVHRLSDTNALQDFVQQALEKYPEKVEEYKNGKKGLIGLFMGEVMKLSRGKADPKIANKLVREALEK